MSNWKRTEREIAAMFGGQRVPITGRIIGSAPDVEHDELSIEVKYRQTLPKWIKYAMKQAVASIKNDKQIPVVFLRQKQQRLADCYVMIKASDFKELLDRNDN